MQKGSLVTSTKAMGSQNPVVIPIRGTGVPQAQMGELGFGVSGTEELTTSIEPIEIGNKQLQQTSTIGSTKLPWQRLSAFALSIFKSALRTKMMYTD